MNPTVTKMSTRVPQRRLPSNAFEFFEMLSLGQLKPKDFQMIRSFLCKTEVPSAQSLWNYGPRDWKRQVANAEDGEGVAEVLGRFTGVALEVFCTGAEIYPAGHKEYLKLIKLLDTHARWLVTGSENVQDGFRLTRFWFRTILVQMSMIGAVEQSEEAKKSLEDKIRLLWSALGWEDSIEICLTPTHNALNTVIPMKFQKSETEWGEFLLVLEPCGEFPVGSKWRAKNGTEWEVVEVKGDNVHVLPEEPPYHEKSFGKGMVRDWTRYL